jgi:alpha-tubulin suppressor-like RCC1 family protein
MVDLPLQNLIVSKICCGFGHTLLLTSSCKVLSFGSNSRGECGVGNLTPVVHKPTLVETTTSDQQQRAPRVVELASKGFHSLLLCEDGHVLGFGANDCFQLGLEDTDDVVPSPRLVPLEDKVRQVGSSFRFYTVNI